MVDAKVKLEKAQIETYLIQTFSKIHDEYGQTLDITLALPTLVDILSGDNQSYDDDKKYTFIGEAACQFAIRCILAKHYNHYGDTILTALAKKFRALARMNSVLLKEFDLKSHMDPSLPATIVQTIAGFLGFPAVEKFIENSVLHVASIELGTANGTKLKAQHGLNPLVNFQLLIASTKGTIKLNSTETTTKQWQVEVAAQLTPISVLFSHKRIAGSKSKAKSAAYQDILNYLEKNPEVHKQLELPDVESGQVHALPIDESEYSGTTDTSNTNPLDPNTIHVSLNHDEDAVTQLSRLLLGNETECDDEEMVESPTKKRMRDHSQGECSKGLDYMFPNGTTTVKTEEPTVKMEDIPMAIPTAPTIPTTNFNLFVGAEPTVDINPKIIKYFKEIFRNPNNTLGNAVSNPSQSKSTFLSLVVKNKDHVECNSELRQVGPPHEPVFSAEVILKSKRYDNVIIKTDGVAKKKKDAECVAFHKLVLLLH